MITTTGLSVKTHKTLYNAMVAVNADSEIYEVSFHLSGVLVVLNRNDANSWTVGVEHNGKIRKF